MVFQKRFPHGFAKIYLKEWRKGPTFPASDPIAVMSQHNTFRNSGTIRKKNRTVLKRFERVELLRKRGEWKEGDRVTGLKKTKPDS